MNAGQVLYTGWKTRANKDFNSVVDRVLNLPTFIPLQ